MGTPYIGEIKMFAGNYAPPGWALCAGQLSSIAENDALYSVIGTTYGGDGQSNFALPNLQGRVPVNQGNGLTLGGLGGEETVTLTPNQLPAHTHAASANAAAGTLTGPAGNVWAGTTTNPYAGASAVNTQMAPSAITSVGGGASHENMIPFLAVNFIIALEGIYPQAG